ncbi:hypothetical protein [Phocaeicola sartorii]|uniref:hypothetical protein n=1 Tax=Phocaeicola sartorii TaxID=671267 RepID=UPI00272BF7B5|nr:hypothetical protein [Phocaeicola sartorii]
MKTIKNIIAESGDDCRVDIDMLHEALLGLPAELYLKLYHKMQEKVIGYPYYAGCCVPATVENEPEDNAKYYDEQPKVSMSYSVGE